MQEAHAVLALSKTPTKYRRNATSVFALGLAFSFSTFTYPEIFAVSAKHKKEKSVFSIGRVVGGMTP